LSFFEKQDFITLMGGYFDRFAEGEFGISLKEIFGEDVRKQMGEIPTEVSANQAEQIIGDNADLIKAVVKVANTLPDLQLKIIMIALGVPPNERAFVGEILRGPVWRGGLTDDQGFEILHIFITQNAKAIRSFFAQKGRELVDHFREEVLPTEADQNGDSPGSTPSSTSAVEPASIPSRSETGPPVASS
jgi:hypothetical protein